MNVVMMRLEGACQMAKTVIIAVNDPNILYLLQRYAEESGLQTVCASRGKDVLALLAQQENPALIILDAAPCMAHYQDATGRKAWRGVKLEAANRHIPLVAYSCLDELDLRSGMRTWPTVCPNRLCTTILWRHWSVLGSIWNPPFHDGTSDDPQTYNRRSLNVPSFSKSSI